MHVFCPICRLALAAWTTTLPEAVPFIAGHEASADGKRAFQDLDPGSEAGEGEDATTLAQSSCEGARQGALRARLSSTRLMELSHLSLER